MTLTQKTFSPAMQRRLRQGAAEIASLDDDIDQLIRLAEIARSVRDELSATMAPRERGFLVVGYAKRIEGTLRGLGTCSETCYPFTAFFNCFPALNFGRLDAGIWIGAPVRGFLPVRADRFATLNLPKPVRRTSSPRLRAAVIALHTASTALAASPLLVPLIEVTAEANSLLFISIASLECRNRNRANTNEGPPSSTYRRLRRPALEVHARAR